MTMTDSLDGLIERVERCTGPDRFLDSRIRAVLEPQEPIVDGCPFYTASLDAALALVERKLPGSHVGLDPIFFVDPESVKWDAVICIARMERWNPVNSDWIERTTARHSVRTLAIILALLRALQSIKTSETK